MAETVGFWQWLLAFLRRIFGVSPSGPPVEETGGTGGKIEPPPQPTGTAEPTGGTPDTDAPEPTEVPPAETPGESEPTLPQTTPRPPAVPPPDSGIASGRGVWIWLIRQAEYGNVEQIIERARSAGLRWVTIKGGDGVHSWAQLTGETVNRIRAAGLQVLGWVYAYGQDTVREAAVARNILSLGCDGLIIDAEAEYEGRPLEAESYMRAIREAYPRAFIAYSSFPLISRHPTFPYIEFGRYCNASMPQCYWKLIGFTPEEMMTRAAGEWSEWSRRAHASGYGNSVKPLIPVGQGFNVGPDEIRRFLGASAEHRGVSLWSWSHMNQEVWDAYSDPARDKGQGGPGLWLSFPGNGA